MIEKKKKTSLYFTFVPSCKSSISSLCGNSRAHAVENQISTTVHGFIQARNGRVDDARRHAVGRELVRIAIFGIEGSVDFEAFSRADGGAEVCRWSHGHVWLCELNEGRALSACVGTGELDTFKVLAYC